MSHRIDVNHPHNLSTKQPPDTRNMIKGPFHLNVSSIAEKLDFEALTEKESEVLCSGISVDPRKHDIYRFFITPKAEKPTLQEADKLSRKQKKQSFHRADRMDVSVKPASNEIQLLGMFPTTCDVRGQFSLDYETEALFEINFKVVRLKLKGKFKNQIRRNKFAVYAGRTNELADWVFLESWIKSSSPFKMKLLCVVPSDLEEDKRILSCNATVSKKSRFIQGITNQQVVIPV